ncbi:serine/threonine protein kinase [Mycobacterium eburneum]|nr:serine/threonine-protein kinase PknD [Mycobacterium eburneum]TDH49148.1 serine/threonine protein kinase [Mycobacterium eburneum]
MEGSQFGKYRLIELLGRGGMGEVWRARDTVIDRVVALKILPAEISRDPLFQQRFRREAQAAARLSSPHVIPIHTHGEVNGRLFVDMRLVDGRDLQSILDRGPLPPRRAAHIIDQAAKALHATHRAGLLHRDVKPSNVLLDADDFAYLIDFGIARAAGELALTAAGGVVGTFHYMAPERFSPDQRTIDARSDVYSLTCVLYECLTAQHPFAGDSVEHQISSHLTTPPPRPSSVNPAVPVGFDAVIARGMAKNPAERYGSAAELARAALDAVDTPTAAPPPVSAPQPLPNHSAGHAVSPPEPRPESFTPPTPPPSPPWWRRRPAILTTAAVLTIAVIVTVVSIAMGHREAAKRQTTLPFTGLREPQGLSVDFGGTVYVADTLHNRVLALTDGSSTPAALPFTDLNYPTGVTADNSGNVYVSDAGNKRVVMLRAGSTTQTQLAFTGLDNPTGITVDSSRIVYVTDTENDRVVSLDTDSNQQTVLPLIGLNAPTGVVVDNGTIYVADGGNNRVLSLRTGSNAPTELPFTGLKEPGGVTVDNKGAVYVTDSGNNRALKLPADSTTQVELPFTGLDYPWGLAVDNLGTVYIAGHSNEVVALRQQ